MSKRLYRPLAATLLAVGLVIGLSGCAFVVGNRGLGDDKGTVERLEKIDKRLEGIEKRLQELEKREAAVKQPAGAV